MAVGPIHSDRAQERMTANTQPHGRPERNEAISGPEHGMASQDTRSVPLLWAGPTFLISSIFHWHLVDREEICPCRMPCRRQDGPHSEEFSGREMPVWQWLRTLVQEPRRCCRGWSQINTVFILRPKPDTVHCIHNRAYTIIKPLVSSLRLESIYWLI